MNILFSGKLEELCRFVDMVNKPDLYVLFNLICRGPMNSTLLSSLTTLSEEQITKILDALHKEGIVECVEKRGVKVYVPRYIMELEEFSELDRLVQKIGDGMGELIDRLIIEHDEMIVKVFESKGGEYSLGSLIAQLILKSIAIFLDGFRNGLREEAEYLSEKLSKQKS